MKCTNYFKADNDSFHLIELVQHLKPGKITEVTAYCGWQRRLLRPFFKDLQDLSLASPGKVFTSEAVLISTGL